VLKGEQPVEMRRTPPRQRRRKHARPALGGTGAIAAAGGGDGETDRYARLNAWRLAEARQQAVPAYVILRDATLAGDWCRRP
jgi:ATP-dependent DNA helicase RecQ